MYSYVNNTKGQSTTTTTLSREIINGTTYKYVYDALGNITEIQNGSGNALYRYVYDGMSQLISDTDYVNNKKSVKYTLSDSSTLLTYYFTYNSRGDIVGIYDGSGELIAHYEYDAWGNVLSVTDQYAWQCSNPWYY